MSASVGIDVGGTYTDLAAVDADGRGPRRARCSRTPADQSEGVAASLAALGGAPDVSARGARHHRRHEHAARAPRRARGALRHGRARPTCSNSAARSVPSLYDLSRAPSAAAGRRRSTWWPCASAHAARGRRVPLTADEAARVADAVAALGARDRRRVAAARVSRRRARTHAGRARSARGCPAWPSSAARTCSRRFASTSAPPPPSPRAYARPRVSLYLRQLVRAPRVAAGTRRPR